jgi:hypothetical protein
MIFAFFPYDIFMIDKKFGRKRASAGDFAVIPIRKKYPGL